MSAGEEKNAYLSREELRQLQLERLQSSLNRVYKNVSHYHRLFTERDVFPDDFRSLADLERLPFTTREDLLHNYPYRMFAVPLREVVRLHSPALTLDQPLAIGFSRNDMEHWAGLVARSLQAAGVTRDDVVLAPFAYGAPSTAFGLIRGAETIGASVIPLAGGHLKHQARILEDYRATVLAGSPTWALQLAQVMESLDLNLNSLQLKLGIFGGEPWTETRRQELERKFHLTALDSYGIDEIIRPGLAWECPAKNGLHVSEDHFYPEIIDPKTQELLPPGREGELVITTLTKEAFPLIRYLTGDITSITYEPCSCGRTFCRIRRISARADDTLILRGLNIVPEFIGQVLSEVSRVPDLRYQLVVEQLQGLDDLEILLEIDPGLFFDEMRKQKEMVDRLRQAIANVLGWEVKIKLVEPRALLDKPRVNDLRPRN